MRCNFVCASCSYLSDMDGLMDLDCCNVHVLVSPLSGLIDPGSNPSYDAISSYHTGVASMRRQTRGDIAVLPTITSGNSVISTSSTLSRPLTPIASAQFQLGRTKTHVFSGQNFCGDCRPRHVDGGRQIFWMGPGASRVGGRKFERNGRRGTHQGMTTCFRYRSPDIN